MSERTIAILDLSERRICPARLELIRFAVARFRQKNESEEEPKRFKPDQIEYLRNLVRQDIEQHVNLRRRGMEHLTEY